jgi:hypothetical protein
VAGGWRWRCKAPGLWSGDGRDGASAVAVQVRVGLWHMWGSWDGWAAPLEAPSLGAARVAAEVACGELAALRDGAG